MMDTKATTRDHLHLSHLAMDHQQAMDLPLMATALPLAIQLNQAVTLVHPHKAILEVPQCLLKAIREALPLTHNIRNE